MNEGQPIFETSPQEEEPKKETVAEKRKSAYAQALETFKEHDSAEYEAEQILFREKIAETGPELAIGGIELKIAAAQEQKDIYAEKKDPFTEEAWAIRVQYLTAMKDMFCLYSDVREKSLKVAGYMEQQMPWLKNILTEAEEIKNTDLEAKVESGAADDYDVDGGYKKAA